MLCTVWCMRMCNMLHIHNSMTGWHNIHPIGSCCEGLPSTPSYKVTLLMLTDRRFRKQKCISLWRHGLGAKRGRIGRPRSKRGQKHPLCEHCRPDECCDTTSSPFQMGRGKLFKILSQWRIYCLTLTSHTQSLHRRNKMAHHFQTGGWKRVKSDGF